MAVRSVWRFLCEIVLSTSWVGWPTARANAVVLSAAAGAAGVAGATGGFTPRERLANASVPQL